MFYDRCKNFNDQLFLLLLTLKDYRYEEMTNAVHRISYDAHLINIYSLAIQKKKCIMNVL